MTRASRTERIYLVTGTWQGPRLADSPSIAAERSDDTDLDSMGADASIAKFDVGEELALLLGAGFFRFCCIFLPISVARTRSSAGSLYGTSGIELCSPRLSTVLKYTHSGSASLVLYKAPETASDFLARYRRDCTVLGSDL